MEPIRGVVQHYAWGDTHFIPALLGEPADGRPWAELWLGTHGNGTATLGDGRALTAVTGRLPYLLKVLAAARPLSLQAHPSAEEARAGFAAGRYPDAEPKPELLVALTPFEALCGFRPVDATTDLLVELGATDLATVLRHDGCREAMASLYHGRVRTGPVLAACAASARPEAAWVTRLAARFPGDASVVATLLLNLVRLLPGQGLQLGPGNVHAYLGGAGIELMTASDNIVRGGLTDKHVDVDELLRVLDPTPSAEPLLPAGECYRLADTPIRLLRMEGPAARVAAGHELVVTSAGATGYLAPGAELAVPPGTTAYVAAAA